MFSAAQKILLNQFQQMKRDPVWGISVEMPNEDDCFEWDVYLQGNLYI